MSMLDRKWMGWRVLRPTKKVTKALVSKPFISFIYLFLQDKNTKYYGKTHEKKLVILFGQFKWFQVLVWLVVRVLWYINLCQLLNTKSILCK